MAWVKKNGVGGVGWNFSVGGVGPLNFGWGQKKKKRGSKFWDGSQVFYEKNILKNFAKFTAKTSVQESVVR